LGNLELSMPLDKNHKSGYSLYLQDKYRLWCCFSC